VSHDYGDFLILIFLLILIRCGDRAGDLEKD
jgi:hypothetical protein